jgi:hypothetical protein
LHIVADSAFAPSCDEGGGRQEENLRKRHANQPGALRQRL